MRPLGMVVELPMLSSASPRWPSESRQVAVGQSLLETARQQSAHSHRSDERHHSPKAVVSMRRRIADWIAILREFRQHFRITYSSSDTVGPDGA
jgi:hypothetical protein